MSRLAIQKLLFGLALLDLSLQWTAAQTTLIATGSVWKYLDDGSDQGTNWQGVAFDDSGWTNGVAPLGYGGVGEVTTINGGPETNRFITSYFRQSFKVATPSAYTNLVVRLDRDDGGIVYLNGVEIFRSNMPEGPIDFTTWASSIVSGAQEYEFYATNLSPALLLAGLNLIAVEIHQVNNTSSDAVFDLMLLANVSPTPPQVTITSPTNGAAFTPPATVYLEASASDFDGTVAKVQFYQGNKMVGEADAEPFSLVISNLRAGNYRFGAVATDDSGATGTSAPVNITVVSPPFIATLVSTGSAWKYLDDGSDQGSAWEEVLFDDTSWKSGPAILGYGNAGKGRPEATVINSGPAGARFITTYFRHQFYVGNSSVYTNLAFGVLRDDGVVVYLNGAEIFRMNMPGGTVTYTTRAVTEVGNTNETFYFPANISPSLLLGGQNLLAVELHQATSTTALNPDVAFDLELDGIGAPALPPIYLERSGSQLILSWEALGAVLQQADSPGGPWAPVPSVLWSPYFVSPGPTAKFYRLWRP
jgi:hypothetical protein